MTFLDPASEIVEAEDGWVWLRPEAHSLRRRQTLGWTLLALTLAVAVAAAAFLEPIAAVGVAGAGAGVAVGLARAATRATHTRAGACPTGILVQMGIRVVQAGWAAVAELRRADVDGHRARLVVGTEDGPTLRTRATFEADAVAAWLDHAAAHARTAGRDVLPVDGGPDFLLR